MNRGSGEGAAVVFCDSAPCCAPGCCWAGGGAGTGGGVSGGLARADAPLPATGVCIGVNRVLPTSGVAAGGFGASAAGKAGVGVYIYGAGRGAGALWYAAASSAALSREIFCLDVDAPVPMVDGPVARSERTRTCGSLHFCSP
jgi:hypothetical protein